jgi:hypothetical protein
MLKRIIKLIWIPTLIIMVGIGLNQLVIRLNGGMPANVGYATASKHAYEILNLPYPEYTGLNYQTTLKYLADILPGFYSIGDVLIVAGLLLYFVMFLNNLKRKREVTE